MALFSIICSLILINSCSIQFNRFKTIQNFKVHSFHNNPIDIYENEQIIGDLGETGDEMALETFKDLSRQTDSLSLQAFLEWEDIKDVMSKGFIDNQTIAIIFKEIGIKSGFMNFIQFRETVDIINQVNSALEETEGSGIDDDDDDVDDLDEDTSDTLKWLESQIKSQI